MFGGMVGVVAGVMMELIQDYAERFCSDIHSQDLVVLKSASAMQLLRPDPRAYNHHLRGLRV